MAVSNIYLSQVVCRIAEEATYRDSKPYFFRGDEKTAALIPKLCSGFAKVRMTKHQSHPVDRHSIYKVEIVSSKLR